MKSKILKYEEVWEKNNLTYNLTLYGTENYTDINNFTENKKLYEEYSPMTLFNSQLLKEI